MLYRNLNSKRQRGATLIVSLIFVLMLTFLGVSVMQDASLEEKMAANLQHYNMAFQEAEAALRAGELALTSIATLPDFDNTGGYYDESYDLNDLINSAASWSTGSWIDYTPDSDNELVISGYALQEMTATIGAGDSLEVGSQQDDNNFYRVTAQAQSRNTSAIVILQSIFER